MQEKHYNIGLDFGTFQTKVCVYHASEDPVKHEFFRFINQNKSSYFIPSRVELLVNNKFNYGFPGNSLIKKEFLFFKMSSANDEEFRIVSDYNQNDLDYNQAVQSGDFSPELISVLYLTYILFIVKSKFKEKEEKEVGGGAIIRRLFARKETEEVRFTVQLGIPTEYSEKVNLQRRRKFENILLISEKLQKKLGTLNDFLDQPSENLIRMVKDILVDLLYNKEQFFEYLNEYGLSVFPETAAGLTYLLKTRQLEHGCYSALDIGCGTSDLSFFRVTSTNEIHYLASESLMIAANNIYQKYLNKDHINFQELRDVEKQIQNIVDDGSYLNNDSYQNAIKQIHEKLNAKIYKLFNGRVYYMFPKTKAISDYNEQPCFLYGGGAKLPINSRFNQILIHDNGNRSTLDPSMLTFAIKEPIDKYLPNVDVLPNDGSWMSDFVLLIVAFGLSFIHHEKDYLWSLIDYKDKLQDKYLSNFVPHPYNEDMYIFNVLERNWA